MIRCHIQVSPGARENKKEKEKLNTTILQALEKIQTGAVAVAERQQ